MTDPKKAGATPASSDVVEIRVSPAEMAERLRGWADHVNPVHLLREAADMIERLTDGNWGNDARTTQLRYRLANEKDRAESAEAELALRDDDLRVERERVRQYEERYRAIEAERDRAIAHDRQPYPTAWAYEQACAALERTKSDNTALREALHNIALSYHFSEHGTAVSFERCGRTVCVHARSLLSGKENADV